MASALRAYSGRDLRSCVSMPTSSFTVDLLRLASGGGVPEHTRRVSQLQPPPQPLAPLTPTLSPLGGEGADIEPSPLWGEGRVRGYTVRGHLDSARNISRSFTF